MAQGTQGGTHWDALMTASVDDHSHATEGRLRGMSSFCSFFVELSMHIMTGI